MTSWYGMTISIKWHVHFLALWITCSQRILNYLAFQSFDNMHQPTHQVISETRCFALKYISKFFSSPGQRPCELLPSLGVRRRLFVVRRKLSHLNLLWNRWTKLNQTWQGWSLGGSLSNLCPTALPSIQDGCCY